MSIWSDIEDVAKSVGGTALSTGESVVGASLSPAGLVWDVVTSPQDFQKDLIRFAGRATDPITNRNTFTGKALSPLLEGAMTAYREGVSEPISTAMILASHASRDGGIGHWGDFFNGSDWSQAYKIAQHQSIGQSIVWGLSTSDDPFADPTGHPYQDWQWHKDHQFLSSVLTGAVDATLSWNLDPMVVGGKFASARKIFHARPITEADQAAGVGNLIENETTKSIGIGPFKYTTQGLKTRADKLTGHIDDEGVYHPGWFTENEKYGAAGITAGFKELRDAPNGLKIAGLISATNKITNPAERINRQRELLAALAGDSTAGNNIMARNDWIGDQLKNIVDGSVNGAEAGAMYDSAIAAIPAEMFPAGSKAENIAEAERQAANLPNLQSFLTQAESYYSDVLRLRGTLRQLPDITRQGERSLARSQEGAGLFRTGEANTAHEHVDPILDSVLGKPLERLYQASPSSMPVRLIHGLTVKTLQAGPKFTDSFKNTRPEFVVNANDADDVHRNVDAYLRRVGGKTPEAMAENLAVRRKFTNDLAQAPDANHRMMIMQRAEVYAKKQVFRKHGLNPDEPAMKAVLLENYARGAKQRSAVIASTQGRAYANVNELENSRRVAQIRYMKTKAGEPQPQWDTLRIDQIDDEGAAIALPFLDTQDATLVPMMPLDELDKVLGKYNNVFRATAKAWADDNLTHGPLADIRRKAGGIADYGFDVGDKLGGIALQLLDSVNRVWKFSVLLRLGYLQRVLLDDHMRISARFGAHVFLHNSYEGLLNMGKNYVKRPYANRWSEYNLRAELDALKAHVGDDEIFARNQEAYAEVGKITKRLEKTGSKALKSPKRIAELESRRAVLLEMNPSNLAETQARIDDIERELESGTYKVDKAHIGQGSLGSEIVVDGKQYTMPHEMPGGFQGDYGDVFRAINSSQGSWERLADRTSTLRQQNMNRSGSFRTITVNDGEMYHLHAWEYALNNHVRNSELASIILKGGTEEDVVKFLTGTARGRELARKLPWNGGSPERWANGVARMVDQYAPTQELRDLLANRRVNSRELDSMFKDVSSRPPVHGADLDSTLGTGAVAFSINHPINAFYKWIGNRTDVMSRHPLFATLYNDEAARLASIRVRAARERGEEMSARDIEEVGHAAREYARTEVNKTLFDMAGQTEMAHFMRFISPFFSAWQEGLNRWWRIVEADPSVARRFFMLFDAPRKLGIVVDSNTGELVQPGEPISDSHMILFQLPMAWGGPNPVSENGSPAYQSDFKVSESAFNLIFQGGGILNPGAGPLVQVPVNYYAVRHADDPQIQNAIKAIMPLGTVADPSQLLLPSAARTAWTVASAKFLDHHSLQYIQMQNMIWRDDLVKFEQDNGRPPNAKEMNDLLDKAGDKTLQMGVMKWITSVTSPAAVQFQSQFTPQLFAYRRLTDLGRNTGKPYFWADQQFLKQYGDAFFPLTQSSSLNRAGLGSTQSTVAAIKAHRALLNEVADQPNLYRMVISFEGEGAYDQTSRNYLYTTQLSPGSNQTFVGQADPRDAMSNALVAQGWADYNKLTNRLQVEAQARGYQNYLDSDWYASAKKRAIDVLQKRNPVWFQEYSTHNDAEYDAQLAGMQIIATNPQLNADPARTDIKVLQNYLALRNQVSQVLQARDAAGGSADPQALANQDVLTTFTRMVNRMVESNTYFQSYMYDGIIERDPYLVSNIVPKEAAA